MRTNRALALILLSGILGACGQPAATPGASPTGTGRLSHGPQPQPVTQGDLVLESVLTSGTAQPPTAGQQLGLAVEYIVINNGREPMLVHDRVPPTLGAGTLPESLNPEHAWVFMSAGRLRLSKQGFSPAPGVRFIAAPMTGARLLEPHDRLRGRAWAPLPATLDAPGVEFDAPRSAIDPNATEWEFCVQVTPGSEGRPSAVDPSVLEVPAAAPNEGELLCSRSSALPPDASPDAPHPGATPVSN